MHCNLFLDSLYKNESRFRKILKNNHVDFNFKRFQYSDVSKNRFWKLFHTSFSLDYLTNDKYLSITRKPVVLRCMPSTVDAKSLCETAKLIRSDLYNIVLILEAHRVLNLEQSSLKN